MVHRDVKPSNLVLEKGVGSLFPVGEEVVGNSETLAADRKKTPDPVVKPVVKILDLGLARVLAADGAYTELTSTGATMGTVDYMAPEQAADSKHADARADIYSLGCTLCYLLTGRPVYPGATPMAKLMAHRQSPLPSLAALRPDAPPSLESVFRRMIAKRPDDRYPSISAALADLERCLADVPASSRGVVPLAAAAEEAMRASDPASDPDAASVRGARAAASTVAWGSPLVDSDRWPGVPAPTTAETPVWRRPGLRWGLAAAGALVLVFGTIWVRNLLAPAVDNAVDNVDKQVEPSAALTQPPDAPSDRDALSVRVADTPPSSLSTAERARLRAKLEQGLRDAPDNEQAARQLATLLFYELTEQVEASWTVLDVDTATSAAGATLSKLPDGSILAGGSARGGDTYLLEARPPLPEITAVRLEAMPDHSLPQRGPGRHESGNFHLAEAQLHVVTPKDDQPSVLARFDQAWASFSYPGMPVRDAIDGDIDTRWHVYGRPGQPHTAVWELADPLRPADSQQLRLALYHAADVIPLVLGRFRLSVTDRRGLVSSLHVRDAAAGWTDAWARLGAAYQASGDVEAARRALDRSATEAPASLVGIRLLRARAEYELGETDQARQRCEELFATLPTLRDDPRLDDLAHATVRRVCGVPPELAAARARLASLTGVLESRPNDLRALSERLDWSLRLGLWREALADAQRCADLQSEASLARMQVASVAILAGDLPAYRGACQRMLARFGEEPNVDHVEQACKTTLLSPADSGGAQPPVQQLDELLAQGVSDRASLAWATATRALAACHAGEPQAALDGLDQPPVIHVSLQHATYRLLIRARALHQLNRPAEARAALDEATSLIPAGLIQRLDGQLDANAPLFSQSIWIDTQINEILRRQTHALLDGSQSGYAVPTQ